MSATAINRIAKKHDLLEEGLHFLGKQLIHPLSEEFRVLGLLGPLYQEKHGERKRSEIIYLLKRAVRDLNKVHDIARSLHSSDPETAHAFKELGRARTLTQVVRLEFFREQIEGREGKGTTWDISAVNLRRESDEIRPVVLATIFKFWTASGRSLTLTTTERQGDDRRAGKLLDFANDVVRELTEPATKMKGETFRKDFDDYKARLKLMHGLEAPINSN